jgi:hypothetical protein
MRTLLLTIALIGAAITPSVCKAQAVDDPFSDYLQRSDSIALWAGNAKETNSEIHTLYPWPRRAFDVRIPTEGRQGVDAIEQMYNVPHPFAHFATPPQAGGTGVGSGSSPQSSANTSTPVQPVEGQ